MNETKQIYAAEQDSVMHIPEVDRILCRKRLIKELAIASLQTTGVET